jgi:hypothetical protein
MVKKNYKLSIICFVLVFCNLSLAIDVESCRKNYSTKKQEIQQFLADMKLIFDASDYQDKKFILKKSGKEIFNYLTNDIFPAWYGTPWSFSGNSKNPGEGSIACGYFVVHTLQDAGFKIPGKMAKQPSENIIKNLIDPKYIKRFPASIKMKKVIDWIRSQGEGLFIVGLDIHVGFIIHKNNRITFCHSSYYNPPLKVVNENIIFRNPLTDSKYRVIGKILGDKMMLKWINGEAFAVKYDYFKRNREVTQLN